MTVSGVATQLNILQALRAQNAFMKIPRAQEGDIQERKDEDVKVSISSKQINTEALNISKPQIPSSPYVTEIKAFADKYNTADIEENDIQEALKYGTSLFADYTA